MAADSGSTFGETRFTSARGKIVTVMLPASKRGEKRTTVLVGTSGATALGEIFVQWVKAGFSLEQRPRIDANEEFSALVLGPDFIWLFDHFLVPTELSDVCFAIGSGADYALGAMHAGATPAQAVEIAARLDSHSAMPVVEVELPGKKRS